MNIKRKEMIEKRERDERNRKMLKIAKALRQRRQKRTKRMLTLAKTLKQRQKEQKKIPFYGKYYQKIKDPKVKTARQEYLKKFLRKKGNKK